ncbi:MAG: hypothetical protein IJ491_06475 [Clostridia bacterium]|nr:hypothetical protein [Clostridia bacterium]
MKKETKIVAVILSLLIIFLSGVVVGSVSKGFNLTINNNGAEVGAAAPVVTTTAAPVTQAPTTQAPVTAAPTTAAPQGGDTTTTAAPATDATTTTAAPSSGAAVPSTPAEVCAAYCKAVNEAKAYTGNASVRRIEQIDVGVDSCSVPMLQSTLDSVVRSFIKSSDETFEMVNGAYQNDSGETRTMNDRLYPGGRNVTVAEANVISATAAAAGDGGYTVTIKFPAETSVYDNGTVVSSPTNHLTGVDPLDLATLDLSPFEIFNADMKYSGATCDATVNAEGKLVKLHINLPLEGTGTAGKGPVKLDIGVSGFMDTTFEITYK